MVHESSLDREWMVRFEVRTTAGVVQFGYLELYGLTSGKILGEIHEFQVTGADYYRTLSGAQGATLHMEECIISPPLGCLTNPSIYPVVDGGSNDLFPPDAGWTVESGNISIYTTSGQNLQ